MKSPWIKKIANIYLFIYKRCCEKKKNPLAVLPLSQIHVKIKDKNRTTVTILTWPSLNCCVPDRPVYLKLRGILIRREGRRGRTSTNKCTHLKDTFANTCLEENHKGNCAILNTKTMKIKHLICLIQRDNVFV